MSQYDIFTVTIYHTKLADLLFNEKDIFYCIHDGTGFLELAVGVNDSETAFRIVEKVKLNDLDAYTFIVSKTVEQPDYDIVEENMQIERYLKGNYLKW